jgi:hypothetical protein
MITSKRFEAIAYKVLNLVVYLLLLDFCLEKRFDFDCAALSGSAHCRKRFFGEI